MAGVAADDGRLLWRAHRSGRTAVIPTPIFYDNHVFVTSGYGVGCNLFKIIPDGTQFKVEEVYANKDLANHHGGVLRVGDHVYGHSDSRGWVCLEFKTGKVVWARPSVGKGALTCADGHLYLRSEGRKGTVALAEVTPRATRKRGVLTNRSAATNGVASSGRGGRPSLPPRSRLIALLRREAEVNGLKMVWNGLPARFRRQRKRLECAELALLLIRIFSIPTGLCPPAQGRQARAFREPAGRKMEAEKCRGYFCLYFSALLFASSVVPFRSVFHFD